MFRLFVLAVLLAASAAFTTLEVQSKLWLQYSYETSSGQSNLRFE